MSTSNIRVYNGKYQGEYLSDEYCQVLDTIIAMDKRNESIPEFKHLIYNLSKEQAQEIIASYEEKNKKPIVLKDKPLGTLRDDQTLGLAFIYYAQRCMLGDSVGLGKTVVTAGLINKLKADYNALKRKFRFCVFTTNSISPQFRMDLVQKTGEYVCLLSDATQKSLQKFYDSHPYTEENKESIVGANTLITAPIFIQWCEQYKAVHKEYPFDLFVVDESSSLGGSTSNISNTFKLLVRNIPKVLFLNATPFETNLSVFYNQLDLIDPTLLPTKVQFQNQFMVMNHSGLYAKPTGEYKNAEDFREYISYRYFARTRQDKGAKMMDNEGVIVYSPLSEVQKKLMRRTSMYRQVFDCPNYLDPTIEFNEENVPKLKSLLELINTKCKGQQVIIFIPLKESQYNVKNWLSKQGCNVEILNGDIKKQKEKQKIIDDFKEKRLDILITNIQKGLNFGNCNYCIFYSVDTNPSQMIQFEGRITRDFDIIGKHFYILCSEGKEAKNLHDVVKQRAEATKQFTNVGGSVLLELIANSADFRKER